MLSIFRQTLTFIDSYRANRPLIGIEIGASMVRLVVLERHRHGFFVKAFGVEPFVKKDDGMDVSAAAASLTRLFMRCGLSSGWAAMVSSASVMTRMLTLPMGLNDDEIDLHIRLEAHRYVPYPLDEVSFDFWVVGVDESGLNVLLVVMREQAVDECVQIAMESGIELSVLDVQEYALARGLSHLMDTLTGCICVLHIDDAKIHLYVVNLGVDDVFVGFDYHKEYLYTPNTPYAMHGDELGMAGGQKWAMNGDDKEDKNDEVGMDFDAFLNLYRQAVPTQDSTSTNESKITDPSYEIRFDGGQSAQDVNHDKTHTNDWADTVSNQQSHLTERLQLEQAQKLRKMMTSYESSMQMNIDTVILSGLADESLRQAVAQVSHKPVQLANPFIGMDTAYPMSDESLSLLPSLVLACGAAMRADERAI